MVTKDIQLYARSAYDAANALIAAMKKDASSDPAKYLPELAKVSVEGVTGKIGFDDKGDVSGVGSKSTDVADYESACLDVNGESQH